jgi:uncharacterized protein YybS (DUF2232 family)
MIELFTIYKIMENFGKIENFENNINNIPTSWIIFALIISFGTAYIAFSCNEYEKPATRALYTIFAFLFSGIYLIYYFIFHVLLDFKCDSRSINNIIKNIKK